MLVSSKITSLLFFISFAHMSYARGHTISSLILGFCFLTSSVEMILIPNSSESFLEKVVLPLPWIPTIRWIVFIFSPIFNLLINLQCCKLSLQVYQQNHVRDLQK